MLSVWSEEETGATAHSSKCISTSTSGGEDSVSGAGLGGMTILPGRLLSVPVIAWAPYNYGRGFCQSL